MKNAYLKGEIDTPIFMKQPPGFEDSKFPVKEGWVWELLKSLYGLKQVLELIFDRCNYFIY